MRLVRPSTPTGTAIGGATLEAHPTYNSGTTYALLDRVLFLDSTIPAWLIYESAQGGNTGNAITDTAWWTYVSYANPYRMFDTVSNSQTTAADQIRAAFFATPLANTVALLNVSGTSATVEVYTGNPPGLITFPVPGTLVYSQTQSLLLSGNGITDWYEYFFGDVNRRTDVIFADLPSYADQVIVVTLDEPGATVAIGTLAVGYGYYLGDTQYGAGVGIIDYSRKVADAFGQYQIVQRTFAKRGNFLVTIPNSRVDELANLLPTYRATPAVWIGADDYGATFIYGFYKDYEIVIRYVSHSVLSLQIEGLS